MCLNGRRKFLKISRLFIIAVCITVLGACAQQQEPEATTQSPAKSSSITISEPKDGAEIKGNVIDLKVEVEGIQIVKADGDTSGKTGHFHVFIDKDPVDIGEVVPREAGIIHSADNPIQITGLTKGSHTLTVVVGDGAHKRLALPDDDEAEASVEVEVEGPSVDASAPAEIAAGAELTIDVKVDGVTLVGADKDQGPAGTTGHLHVIVDPATAPAANGQPIPKDERNIHTTETSIKIATSLLTPGEHTIWIVLGDKSHIPFAPLVADKITVTVK
jgi:hypothetical protein